MKRNGASPNGRTAYRRMLLEKREQFLAALGVKIDTLAGMGRVAEDDQAQISHDEFISLHLNSLEFSRLRMVEEALERIEAGGYGVCLACEEAIPDKRLKALPWARYCVRCQENDGAELDRERDTVNA